MTLIRGGTVLTPDGWQTADVRIEGNRISEIGKADQADQAAQERDVIDASGCLVGPGFVDLHTHLREPGETWKEDIASGSRAAVAGGFTAIVAMPNTTPPVDVPELVARVVSAGKATNLVDVIPSGTLTIGRAGASVSDLEGMYAAGVRIFTDDGDCVSDHRLVIELMRRIARLDGALLAQHAEDPVRCVGGHMHEGPLSRQLGIGGLPAEAESDIVARDLAAVRETGARYHCQHVSSGTTVELIRRAKAEGLPVTAEVTPHHLVLDVTSVESLDTDFKMYPPLREEEDRRALVNGLIDGTIDAVATDHAPHTASEKAVPFSGAPRGVIGLETAASAVWETAGDPSVLFRVLSLSPARIASLTGQGRALTPGALANVVVFDPTATWFVSEFASKSENSPFRGREMRGAVRATIFSGRVVHRTDRVAA